MLGTICLIVLMLIATLTDVWKQKIYNWTTYTGILLALVISGLATWLNRNDLSVVGIEQSLFGLIACGLIMIICFVLFQVGGGDVKLLAMAGAFLGPQLGIETLLWTFVLGMATSLVILIWQIGFFTLVRRGMHQLLLRLNIGKWDPVTAEEQDQLSKPLYLAPSALVATLIVKFGWMEQVSAWMS